MKHRVEIFKGNNNQWYWHVKSANNKIIESSGEGYKTKWGAKRAVKKNLNVDKSNAKIVYPLIVLLLIALTWALATRTHAQKAVSTQTPVSCVTNQPPQTNEQVGK